MAPRAHVCAGGPAAAGQHVLPPQVRTFSNKRRQSTACLVLAAALKPELWTLQRACCTAASGVCHTQSDRRRSVRSWDALDVAGMSCRGGVCSASASAGTRSLAHSGGFPHRRFEAPTRAEAAAAVLRLVQAHPSHDIVIGVDSLGKGGALREFEGDRMHTCIQM